LKNSEMTNQNRRNFLRAVPAAAVGITMADLLPTLAMAQAAIPMSEGKFQVISAQDLADDIKALEAKPGSKRLFTDKNFTIDLWVEKAKSAPEFEWHEGRDHIIRILDGETVYELGGTPQKTHANGPGEWLAPASEGATKVTLKKGDVVIIRRGTAHKRSTARSVTLTLTAPMTPSKG
jgi:mannose-6-phosphate isomerase-like protein (cupin superfamily)